MDMLNIKPLSEDKQWSQGAQSGAEATGVGPAPVEGMPSTSSEERLMRRVVGRWGAEWLS